MSNGTVKKNDGLVKIAIVVIDGSSKGAITAQFNPQELSFSKNVGWSDDNLGLGTDFPGLMFTSGQAITLSLELLFDGYETGDDIRPDVKRIVNLCHVDASLHRPPMVELKWGDNDVLGIGRVFRGVVDSATAKYTMFTSAGIPCRASVTVALKQADTVSYKREDGSGDNKKTVKEYTFTSAADLGRVPGAKDQVEKSGKDVTDPSIYPVHCSIEEKGGSTGQEG